MLALGVLHLGEVLGGVVDPLPFPGPHRQQDRPHLPAAGGEAVLVPLGAGVVRDPLHDVDLDQAAQPGGEHRAGDRSGAQPFVVLRDAVQRHLDDPQAPFIADDAVGHRDRVGATLLEDRGPAGGEAWPHVHR